MTEDGAYNRCVATDTDSVAASSLASNLPTLSTPNVALKFNLLESQWSDVTEGDDGVASSIFGVGWEEFSSKQLRIICSRLNIKGVRNAKKARNGGKNRKKLPKQEGILCHDVKQ